MNSIYESQVFSILSEIANLNFFKPCINERYLHHYFTMKIQKVYPIVYEDVRKGKLHPEWATAIKDYRNGGKYQKVGNEYKIKDGNGTTGYIDFVLGDYDNPEMGIEFKCNRSWNFQSLVFDYMKLMDRNNSIQKVISFSIIYREKDHSNKLPLELNGTIDKLTKRLGNRMDNKREFLFWILEIAPNSCNSKKVKSWYCNDLEYKFQEKMPLCD